MLNSILLGEILEFSAGEHNSIIHNNGFRKAMCCKMSFSFLMVIVEVAFSTMCTSSHLE